MITKGIYSATCSVLNNDYSLNIDATINHAAMSIKMVYMAPFLVQQGKAN